MNNNLGRLYRTIRHLKVGQIYHRLYYGARGQWRQWTGFKPALRDYKKPADLDVNFPFFSEKSLLRKNTFEFLNKSETFTSEIDWNFMEYGKLWNYNLLYFDYLNQPDLIKENKLRLVNIFLDKFDSIQFARDPYPISLRCINWIKFLIKNGIQDQQIEHAIYQQYYILLDNLEYHLLGNHLLENGCSLLFGGVYFDDKNLLRKARSILITQLDEQILDDGGHFERSPMYHQLLLYRLMDCYNILKTRDDKTKEFQQLIKNNMKRMMGWLKAVTFNDGTIPHVNDATINIAPTTNQLAGYAHQLGLDIPNAVLGESGYRMIKETNFEWFIDIGDIGPDYIPGHAHSDTFSFILHMHDKPVIVDTGVSTYEEGERRQAERSTASHNTVMINGAEQTEVWKSFRVGRRAHIKTIEEGPNYISAEHDGYKHLGFNHRRTFEWDLSTLIIIDRIEGKEEANAIARIHFHPRLTIKRDKNSVIADDLLISFSDHNNIQLKPYQYAMGYNRLIPASMVEIVFKNKLETRIAL